ncbi:hypothetical protein IWX49DRAFT_8215 [Phyllosticta citricarpa]
MMGVVDDRGLARWMINRQQAKNQDLGGGRPNIEKAEKTRVCIDNRPSTIDNRATASKRHEQASKQAKEGRLSVRTTATIGAPPHHSPDLRWDSCDHNWSQVLGGEWLVGWVCVCVCDPSLARGWWPSDAASVLTPRGQHFFAIALLLCDPHCTSNTAIVDDDDDCPPPHTLFVAWCGPIVKNECHCPPPHLPSPICHLSTPSTRPPVHLALGWACVNPLPPWLCPTMSCPALPCLVLVHAFAYMLACLAGFLSVCA